MEFMTEISSIQNIIYIISSILFITGIKMLGKEDTAVKGNFLSALAMFIAVSITLIDVINPVVLLSGIAVGAVIGSAIALRVKMTSIPEMVALFNGFGGLSSFFLAWSEFNNLTGISLIMILSFMTVLIGGITFSGSVIAFFKLSEILKSFIFAILGAEYILNILPQGTHEFEKLIKPSEMKDYIDRASLVFEEVKGMSYLPFLDIVRLTDDPSVNYIIHATKK